MRTIDDIYMEIAQHLIEQIDESWKECEIKTEFFEDAAEFDVTYTRVNDERLDLDAGYNLFRLFKELFIITTEDSDNKWNRATYTLEPTGKFNIDFEWDQALADEIERLNNE